MISLDNLDFNLEFIYFRFSYRVTIKKFEIIYNIKSKVKSYIFLDQITTGKQNLVH